ncbi:antitoxin Xre/MbcA/ParS toxin-binding domain-containing protein [Pricia sp.]|uniref:antitoxin Xre/MbcA/ParS toxin-binding domain-containing protein n=1 Tax=Pricia sp. TaxID=2268138 RepID=UPI00359478A0
MKKKYTKNTVANKANEETIRILRHNKIVAEVPVTGNSFYFLNGKLKNKSAVPALFYNDILPLIDFLGFRQKDLADFLHVDASTITRWKKNETEIGVLRTKIILDIDEIIAKGIRIFDGEADFKDWLAASNYALGDKRPIELLKDPYGTESVDEALEAISWGAYL